MQRYRAEHPDQPILYLDAGRAFPLRTQESDVVVPHMARAFQYLGLDAMNAGDQDLDAGLNPFRAILRDVSIPAVSANLLTVDTNQPVLPPYLVITPRQGSGRAPGPKVVVVGLTRPNHERVVPGDSTAAAEVRFTDPGEIADQVLPKLGGEGDVLIVLANMEAGTARLLAGRHPEIDLIIGCNADQYEIMDTEFQGVPIIMTGFQGKFLVRLDLFRQSGPRRWRVAREITTLNASVEPDEEGRRLVDTFLAELEDRARLRVETTRKDPRSPEYVGPEACAKCHAEAARIWSGTRHAAAWEPLQKAKATINTLCVQCHTVGFLKPNGFYLNSPHNELANVGCESCHGPGGNHVKSPAKSRLARSGEETCRGCHTIGQSPDFNFAQYWSRIQH